MGEKWMSKTSEKPAWMEWLDRERVKGKPVLYVALDHKLKYPMSS